MGNTWGCVATNAFWLGIKNVSMKCPRRATCELLADSFAFDKPTTFSQDFLPSQVATRRIYSFSLPRLAMEAIFGNSSSASTTRWEPEPTRRGSFGILITCLVTLGLCVWTAVHLNLPARDEQPWDWISTGRPWKRLRCTWPWNQMSWPGQTLRKAAWTVLGLLAPEMVSSPFCVIIWKGAGAECANDTSFRLRLPPTDNTTMPARLAKR